MNQTNKLWVTLATVLGLALAILITRTTLAQVPPPMLTISSLGSNQFSIAILNGTNTATYELYWTPALSDLNYPWQLLSVGDVGQTNFSVNGGVWPVGFFEVGVGTDWDNDGIPNWQDANPNDASVGILSITIDSPINGTTLN